MLRDTLDNTKVTSAFNYAARTASANGTNIIDMRGFGSATFVVQLATVTTADSSNFFTFTIEHGDDSSLSDAATVTAALGLLGTNLVINDSATQSNMRGMMGYVGGKRYLRLVGTETGTASAAWSADCIQQLASTDPVGDQAFA
jgi:hypothetical protein